MEVTPAERMASNFRVQGSGFRKSAKAGIFILCLLTNVQIGLPVIMPR